MQPNRGGGKERQTFNGASDCVHADPPDNGSLIGARDNRARNFLRLFCNDETRTRENRRFLRRYCEVERGAAWVRFVAVRGKTFRRLNEETSRRESPLNSEIEVEVLVLVLALRSRTFEPRQLLVSPRKLRAVGDRAIVALDETLNKELIISSLSFSPFST